MNDTIHPALLPSGFRDILPPEARIEAQIVDHLMAVLGSHGFERVKPPLVEFETSLLD
ncbi:MAG: phosphoribosyltransferase regulatory subunit, partial [Aliidongia sp.]|nr:phosphoribosyltransferase regulatory subunit [Aliidongia sp.]